MCLDNCQSLNVPLLFLLLSLSLFSKRIQSDSITIWQTVTVQWFPSYSESRSRNIKWFTSMQPHVTSPTSLYHFLAPSLPVTLTTPMKHVIHLDPWHCSYPADSPPNPPTPCNSLSLTLSPSHWSPPNAVASCSPLTTPAVFISLPCFY